MQLSTQAGCINLNIKYPQGEKILKGWMDPKCKTAPFVEVS